MKVIICFTLLFSGFNSILCQTVLELKPESLFKKHNSNQILTLDINYDSVKLNLYNENFKLIKVIPIYNHDHISSDNIIDFDLYDHDSTIKLALLINHESKDNCFSVYDNDGFSSFDIKSEIIYSNLFFNSSDTLILYNTTYRSNLKKNKKCSEIVAYDLISHKVKILSTTTNVKCNLLNMISNQKFVDASDKYLISVLPYELSFEITNMQSNIKKTIHYRSNNLKLIDSMEQICKYYKVSNTIETLELAQQLDDDSFVRPVACYLDSNYLYVIYKAKNTGKSYPQSVLFDVLIIKFKITDQNELELVSENLLGNYYLGKINESLKTDSINCGDFPLTNCYIKYLIIGNYIYYVEKLDFSKNVCNLTFEEFVKMTYSSNKKYLIKKPLNKQ